MQLCTFPWVLWQGELSTCIPQPQGSGLVSCSCTIAWCPLKCLCSPFPSSSETPSKLDSKPISLTFSQHKTFAYLVGFMISVLLPCSSFVTILQCCLSSDTCRIYSSVLKTKPSLLTQACFSLGWLHSSGSILAQRHNPLPFSPEQSASTAVHPPALSRTHGALKMHQEPEVFPISAGTQHSPGRSLPQRSWRKVVAFIRWSSQSLQFSAPLQLDFTKCTLTNYPNWHINQLSLTDTGSSK